MSTTPAADFAIAVLVSGGGTNLQAIIDATVSGNIPGKISLVASDNPDAYGLERANQAGIPTGVLEAAGFESRSDYDRALIELVARSRPQLVTLAGFMRILGSEFVDAFRGRILNIHPALLPRHRGLNTHRRALEGGDSEHGASVHFVTEELDAGPVVLQARVPVLADDDPERLAARVLDKEHVIYPLAVRWFAEGRLHMKGDKPWLDQVALDGPKILDELPPAEYEMQ